MNRFLSALAITLLAIGLWPNRSYADVNSVPGTLGAANAAVSVSVVDRSTCSADIGSGWVGTITFQVVGQFGGTQSASAFTYAGASQGSTTTSAGEYYWPSAGAGACQVKMTSYVSGSASVLLKASNGVIGGAGGASGTQPSPLYTTPVHDSNPVQPSPLYTTPVTCSAYPCGFPTPPNVFPQPSPLYTQPVTTPAPANTDYSGSGNVSIFQTEVSGAMKGVSPVGCNHHTAWSTATGTWILLVPSQANQAIYICGFYLQIAGGAMTLQTSATNTCGSPTTIFTLTAGNNVQDSSAYWRGLGGPNPFNGLAICVTSGSATTSSAGILYYTQGSPGP